MEPMSQIILFLTLLNPPCNEAEKCVQQLNSNVFANRVIAESTLKSLGWNAFATLEYSAARNQNSEVRVRCQQLVEQYYDVYPDGMDEMPWLANVRYTENES